MSRLVIFCCSVSLFLMLSCEKCMTCSYSYTETTVVQTVNGEEEKVTPYEGRSILDTNGQAWRQECLKEGDFTIVDAYENEKQTTDKSNFEYTCTEQ